MPTMQNSQTHADGEKTLAAGIPQAVVEAHVPRAVPIIRAWREHIGIAQGELADRMGVSQAAVAKLEKPGAKPRHTTLEKVATALGISVTQLDVQEFAYCAGNLR